MKITLKNLGPLKDTSFELGGLTVLCGPNNSGKTYAAYALYGFLEYWANQSPITLEEDFFDKLLQENEYNIPKEELIALFVQTMRDANDGFRKTDWLKRNLLVECNPFIQVDSNLSHEVTLQPYDVDTKYLWSSKPRTYRVRGFTCSPGSPSEHPADCVKILFENKNQEPVIIDFFKKDVKHIIRKVLLHVFSAKAPQSLFIASAERNGTVLFQKEIDFTRSTVFEAIQDDLFEKRDVSAKRVGTPYPAAVKSNLEFVRFLPLIRTQFSFLETDDLKALEDMAGGHYEVSEFGEVTFNPLKGNQTFTFTNSSSSVRSLSLLWFYLRHNAKKHDLIIIDEPELNLHPETQRRVTRMLARLVNAGMRVLITTHSDYIIRELNTLIMLSQDEERVAKIRDREGYSERECIAADRVKVFMTEPDGAPSPDQAYKFVAADIDPVMGIAADTFDRTIEDINRIQDDVLLGSKDEL